MKALIQPVRVGIVIAGLFASWGVIHFLLTLTSYSEIVCALVAWAYVATVIALCSILKPTKP